jgi:hypothetical protein
LSTSPRHVNAAADLGLLISHHVHQYHASARALLPAVAGPTYQPPPPQLCTASTSPPTRLCLGWVVVTARSRSCHAANPIPDPPPILSCRYGELDTPHLSLSLIVRVLYPGYHGPSITAQKIWIRHVSLQRLMTEEPNTPYRIWTHHPGLDGRDHQPKKN